MIDVLEPGFLTTVQDEGRPGHYKPGIGPSGAMDLLSYRLGNGLVGNAPGCASLEMTFTGPKLRFREPTSFAVTGGDLPVFLNGQEVEGWARHDARADDVLHFGFLRSGVRAYLALAGGVDVPLYLGSRSTHVLCRLGGLDGRPLVGGDTLTCGDGFDAAPRTHVLDKRFVTNYPGHAELRYVRGLFDYRLTDQGRRDFADTEWSVTPAADRTGIRLTSSRETVLEFVPREPPFGTGSDPSNVADAGYPLGSIQIPSGVEPIVLARDVVTAGGYFTVGAVCTADLDVLSQVPTRGGVRFVPVTIDEAMQARRARTQLAHEALASLT